MDNQKKILNSLLIITAIFSTLVFTGVETFAKIEATKPVAQTPTTTATTQAPQAQKASSPQNIPQKNVYKITHMKQHSLKASLFKFVIAMLCVLISSLVLLLGLKFYKKFSLKNKSKTDNMDYNKSLDSPKDLKEAINLFLEKTDK